LVDGFDLKAFHWGACGKRKTEEGTREEKKCEGGFVTRMQQNLKSERELVQTYNLGRAMSREKLSRRGKRKGLYWMGWGRNTGRPR